VLCWHDDDDVDVVVVVDDEQYNMNEDETFEMCTKK
jgi:hypothetical protein